MKLAKHWIAAGALLLASGWSALAQTISSPKGGLQLHFALTNEGVPTYRLSFANGEEIIRQSRLGLEMTDGKKSFDKDLLHFAPYGCPRLIEGRLLRARDLQILIKRLLPIGHL